MVVCSGTDNTHTEIAEVRAFISSSFGECGLEALKR